MSVVTPTGDNELLGQAVAMRKITRLERLLGPDNYTLPFLPRYILTACLTERFRKT